jgi:hypothetical protein
MRCWMTVFVGVATIRGIAVPLVARRIALATCFGIDISWSAAEGSDRPKRHDHRKNGNSNSDRARSGHRGNCNPCPHLSHGKVDPPYQRNKEYRKIKQHTWGSRSRVRPPQLPVCRFLCQLHCLSRSSITCGSYSMEHATVVKFAEVVARLTPRAASRFHGCEGSASERQTGSERLELSRMSASDAAHALRRIIDHY